MNERPQPRCESPGRPIQAWCWLEWDEDACPRRKDAGDHFIHRLHNFFQAKAIFHKARGGENVFAQFIAEAALAGNRLPGTVDQDMTHNSLRESLELRMVRRRFVGFLRHAEEHFVDQVVGLQ